MLINSTSPTSFCVGVSLCYIFSKCPFLFSLQLFVLSSFGLCDLYILTSTQSGSQLSVNEDSVEFSTLPVDQTSTIPLIKPNIASENTPIPSSCTTPSCTPLPLELHIDEDGCSTVTSSSSALVVTSSSTFQHSQLHMVDDGGSVVSEVSHVKSFSVSNTIKPPSQSMSIQGSSSSVPKSFSPVLTSKSPSPVTERVIHDPVCRAKTASQSDFKCSSPSPVSKIDSPVAISPSPELKNTSPITASRLSSPIPKSVSSVTIPNNASPETVPKRASPVPMPRLSSPVSKISSPVSIPNVSNSAFEPNYSRVETPSKNTGPVLHPSRSSPVTPVVKSPALVTRKTYTFTGINSPTGSPVQPAVAQSNSPTSSPSYKWGRKITDLTRPCQDPLLDHALDKFLSPDSTHQPPVSVTPGDEDRAWEEEDGFYPDFSREGTLTPMTESSWMDECFTPSTCPGTPDTPLDLPTQQPSAVERLSASGQVGQSL